jgi:hypothetical protein
MKSSNVEEGDLDSPSRNNVEDSNTLCWREADHGDGDDGESGAFAPRLWRPLGGAIWLVIAHSLSVVSPAMSQNTALIKWRVYRCEKILADFRSRPRIDDEQWNRMTSKQQAEFQRKYPPIDSHHFSS